jgi:hypothetical protein
LNSNRKYKTELKTEKIKIGKKRKEKKRDGPYLANAAQQKPAEQPSNLEPSTAHHSPDNLSRG